METDETIKIRDALVEAVLPDVPFEGWKWTLFEKAAQEGNYEEGILWALFPGGLPEAVSHFSDWADRKMMEALDSVDPTLLKVRERVALAVKTRIKVLTPYKEAVKLAGSYGAIPPHGWGAGQAVWRTADVIWEWAGDTATDYNRYTKRGILSGVLATTTLAWLGDESTDNAATYDFLDRRIENVMQMGKILGKIKRSA